MSFSLSDFPVGSYWKRSDIHALLGGQEQGGISTPSQKPYIIIFSSPRGEEFGYEDGRNPDGFYHYTGEGQVGDMKWVRGNRAIRDHAQDGKILLVFETDKDGRRCFLGPMSYAGHYAKRIPDKNGNRRVLQVLGERVLRRVVVDMVRVSAARNPERCVPPSVVLMLFANE